MLAVAIHVPRSASDKLGDADGAGAADPTTDGDAGSDALGAAPLPHAASVRSMLAMAGATARRLVEGLMRSMIRVVTW
jgi:hypothetical protein